MKFTSIRKIGTTLICSGWMVGSTFLGLGCAVTAGPPVVGVGATVAPFPTVVGVGTGFGYGYRPYPRWRPYGPYYGGWRGGGYRPWRGGGHYWHGGGHRR